MRCVAVVAGLAFGLMSWRAEAETLRFDFNGVSATLGAVTFDFQVNKQPTPSRSEPNHSFTLEGVRVFEKDAATGSSAASLDIIFLSSALVGGFTMYDPVSDNGLRLLGKALFSGSTATPTFSTGIFNLTGFQTAGGNLVQDTDIVGVLNVSAVPLPSSASMFCGALLALAGFGYSMDRWVAPRDKKAAAAA